ncbi:hypothetical protein [Candidatus Similichlamydia laticola]|uniref:Uncharacterized protein n=1 Tax=Candidatus Similichlamydia laticola TaxID=2170265 RepID=A0A369KF19_9BACT|nr:hypothetical protein [Candidatus Similichlamydia laticola]RDB31295.1 hypothetical protein HAT2_00602 [Candidatus Similichlamydia laticola]
MRVATYLTKGVCFLTFCLHCSLVAWATTEPIQPGEEQVETYTTSDSMLTPTGYCDIVRVLRSSGLTIRFLQANSRLAKKAARVIFKVNHSLRAGAHYRYVTLYSTLMKMLLAQSWSTEWWSRPENVNSKAILTTS